MPPFSSFRGIQMDIIEKNALKFQVFCKLKTKTQFYLVYA